MTEAEKFQQSQMVPEHLNAAAEDVLHRIEEVFSAPDRAENDEIRRRLDEILIHHGFHAYRYEMLSDGSVIAIWSDMPGELKIKAFEDMREASDWSPRDER